MLVAGVRWGLSTLTMVLQMRSLPMPDTRLDPSAIRKVMGQQAGCLKAALREMLFRDTPSARR